MGPPHGTKARIIERNKYNPRSVNKAYRKVRVITTNGATQTYKKVGDCIITDRAKVEIKTEGFQS